MNRGKVLAAIVVSAALTAASVACSGSPQPHPQTEQTATIAGLPVTDGPTGPRGGVPDAVRTVENAANDVVDKLAVNAVADIEEFWRDTYPPGVSRAFCCSRPIGVLGLRTELSSRPRTMRPGPPLVQRAVLLP